jgi:hypothetical protein
MSTVLALSCQRRTAYANLSLLSVGRLPSGLKHSQNQASTSIPGVYVYRHDLLRKELIISRATSLTTNYGLWLCALLLHVLCSGHHGHGRWQMMAVGGLGVGGWVGVGPGPGLGVGAGERKRPSRGKAQQPAEQPAWPARRRAGRWTRSGSSVVEVALRQDISVVGPVPASAT